MINQEGYMEINILAKQGLSIREIARKMGMSRNTVRRYLRNEREPLYTARQAKPSKLDGYKNYLIKRIEEAKPICIPAPVLLHEIKEKGYTGAITILREFIRDYQGAEIKEEIKRFETDPGEQMQADWTWMNKGKDPLGAFVAILGYSRKAYVEFVKSEQEEVLISCHENAFNYFEGIPKQALYDNMKTVVIQRDKYGSGKHGFQKTFYDFAKHYGFIPKLCRPYRAQTKGKVERFNQYLKRNFYYPFVTRGEEIDIDILNYEVKKWLLNIADKRFLRERKSTPQDLFEVEKASLQVIPPRYVRFKETLQLPAIHVFQHDLETYERLGRFV